VSRFNFKNHPGTVPLIGMALLGAIAGAERGTYGPLIGAGIMLAVFGPFYLIGAYRRKP
jgi:hypothetical protein